ncbi:MAG: glycosyltransferase family 39 protein [Cyanosarcina radialis HA8281-LM2]|jgi:uncharacterized membrane protein|nr:glycosyltransferase family 39 protein [Cyanosarcina radialis HA8281-LM2]
MNAKQKNLLLLLLWIAIGAGLRFAQLTSKPPWTDEFATMVFSLGRSFADVPLDRSIPIDLLMQPLQVHPVATTAAVLERLSSEDHHPPLYFVLAHWWMQLFPAETGGYLSLWGARSLPALFGVLSIPAVYGLSRLAFSSPLAGQLAAAMMAVSPFGIFLAQEARHYTLGILMAIASLGCLVIAVQRLQQRQVLPIRVVLAWVAINTLGIATHYFFVIALAAEALVLIALQWFLWKREEGERGREGERETIGVLLTQSAVGVKDLSDRLLVGNQAFSGWWRIYAVAAGTMAGVLVLSFFWQRSYDPQMTEWIRSSDRSWLQLINPVFQSLAAWLTMMSLLPVEATDLGVVIASGAVMLAFFIWAIPILYRSLRAQWQHRDTRLATGVLGGVVLSAIALFFAISYGLGFDITRGARYNFVYFPAVIALLGAILAACWRGQSNTSSFPSSRRSTATSLHSSFRSKRAVAIIWLMGFLSGITVVCNLGYRKYYRPDVLVPIIQASSSVPILIATTHNTLVQTGEMMGIAWELLHSQTEKTLLNPQFLLAHQNQRKCEGTECAASTTLQQTIDRMPKPLDLWLLNFQAPFDSADGKCISDRSPQIPVYGYEYQLYHCPKLATDNS